MINNIKKLFLLKVIVIIIPIGIGSVMLYNIQQEKERKALEKILLKKASIYKNILKYQQCSKKNKKQFISAIKHYNIKSVEYKNKYKNKFQIIHDHELKKMIVDWCSQTK